MLKLLRADNDLVYLWKPAGLPSTFGTEESFLEIILEGTEMKIARRANETQKQLTHYLYLPPELRQSVEKEWEEEVKSYVATQKKTFSRKEERGLVNRIDTPTAGYLYFARTKELYAERSDLQQKGNVIKHYYALAHGDMRYMRHVGEQEGQKSSKIQKEGDVLRVSYGLAHHAHLDDRMVAIVSGAELEKTRGATQSAQSDISIVEHLPEHNMTLVKVTLTKGVRHQIRVHLAALGYPLVGDELYGKRQFEKLRKSIHMPNNTAMPNIPLHLRSMGCEVIR